MKKFLIVPIGFVCDHTEILFDVDVQAAEAARAAGVALRRTESLNTSPTFIRALAALVTELANRDAGSDVESDAELHAGPDAGRNVSRADKDR